MKYIKMLGLLAVAAAAFMAFAGVASADELTNSKNETVGSIHATSEGHAVLDAPFGKVECNSTVAGNVTQDGAGKDIKGNITTLDFTNCTGTKTVTVAKAGTLTLDVTGTNVGTLTSSGAEVKVFDHSLGIECIYETNSTHIGTVTGSVTNPKVTDATLHIDSAAIPRTGGNFFCGGSGEWTGSYAVTSPTPLHLDAS